MDIFAYLVLLYGGSAIRGELEVWGTKLTHGYVPGDLVGNLAVAAHLLLAVIVMLAGPLQLIPQVRAHMPVFHRWNGRTYLVAVLLTSIAGLYMLWVHGTVGGLVLAAGQSLDALLIIVFGIFALRAAVARDFVTHRRWALRLFMVVSAVWFFRAQASTKAHVKVAMAIFLVCLTLTMAVGVFGAFMGLWLPHI